MRFETRIEHWPLREPFVISRESIDDVALLFLSIESEGVAGRAEAVGVDYRGETPEQVEAEVTFYLRTRDVPPSRDGLARDLPRGGARNAIDCALWDWESKRAGRRAWSLDGGSAPRSTVTAFTLSLDRPVAMAAAALTAPAHAFLKLKLGGGDGRDVERVRRVREAVGDRDLVVDINQGWSIDELNASAPELAALGVLLIEQPLPAGVDAALDRYSGDIPLCADESFDDRTSFDALPAAYRFVNIKLDKSGGLTEAIACKAEARRRGLGVFVGSMLGTSLGMAPAFLVAQGVDYVDLDGPLLLERDRHPAIVYDRGIIRPFGADLWG